MIFDPLSVRSFRNGAGIARDRDMCWVSGIRKDVEAVRKEYLRKLGVRDREKRREEEASKRNFQERKERVLREVEEKGS